MPSSNCCTSTLYIQQKRTSVAHNMSDPQLPRYPRTVVSSKTAVPPRHLNTLMYTLPVRRLKVILSHVVTDATLISVDELKSTQLTRLYILNMSDGGKLLLSLSPSLTVRLLRHEATTLFSEAVLVSFASTLQHQREEVESSLSNTSTASQLSKLIPKLLKYSGNNREVGYPYSIFEPMAGVPLSTISIYLSIPERGIIDRNIGNLARSLAGLTSPSGRFGMVNKVLPDPFTATPPSTSDCSPPKPLGSNTWSEAFNTLLESILRDGEDMAVILPYDTVRAHFKRLSWRLDSVLLPRLVLLNLGDETNVMVERDSDDSELPSSSPTSIVKVTGLRSWSQGIFGDPLIASCFDEPSEGLIEGWQTAGDDIIEDEEGVEDRKMLYKCYRAIVKIVTEYYRPQSDSSRRELEARRKLTTALAELESASIDCGRGGVEVVKRSRTRTNEMETSKRQKFETG